MARPRWVRRFIIIVFVLMAFVPGLIGLIGLVTEDDSPTREPLPRNCPTLEPGLATIPGCVQRPLPTGP